MLSKEISEFSHLGEMKGEASAASDNATGFAKSSTAARIPMQHSARLFDGIK
jgi:hypothetical protein